MLFGINKILVSREVPMVRKKSTSLFVEVTQYNAIKIMDIEGLKI